VPRAQGQPAGPQDAPDVTEWVVAPRWGRGGTLSARQHATRHRRAGSSCRLSRATRKRVCACVLAASKRFVGAACTALADQPPSFSSHGWMHGRMLGQLAVPSLPCYTHRTAQNFTPKYIVLASHCSLHASGNARRTS
jgi:hypothetical protein